MMNAYPQSSPMPSTNTFDSSGNDYTTDISNFEVSDLLIMDQWPGDELSSVVTGCYQNFGYGVTDQLGLESGNGSSSQPEGASSTYQHQSEIKKDAKQRYAFKTQSEIEVLDDGFKWRKYGKKMVKHSPNPRNYYRCSVEGCPIKKRVERDQDDPRFVITTYDGQHNHQTPN